MKIDFRDMGKLYYDLSQPNVSYETQLGAHTMRTFNPKVETFKETEKHEVPIPPYNSTQTTFTTVLPFPLCAFTSTIQRDGKFYSVNFLLSPTQGSERICFDGLESAIRERYGPKWISFDKQLTGHIIDDEGSSTVAIRPVTLQNEYGPNNQPLSPRIMTLGLFMGSEGSMPRQFRSFPSFRYEMGYFSEIANFITNAAFDGGINTFTVASKLATEHLTRYDNLQICALFTKVKKQE